MGIASVSGAAAGVSIDINLFDAREAVQVPDDDADALYRDRETTASATRDFESTWKLARVQYWLGTNGLPEARRRAALEQGIVAGRAAAAIEPRRPEGLFWTAANMGALAESFGLRQGVKYRKPIKELLETVLALDPAFLQGSADRALGRWYFKVPGLFGGSTARSEEHLRRALTYGDNSVITRVFLAETMEALGKRDAAREELRAALDAPLDPDWAPEDRRFKQQAEALLKKLSR
jgi:TRAP transporter T-component